MEETTEGTAVRAQRTLHQFANVVAACLAMAWFISCSDHNPVANACPPDCPAQGLIVSNPLPLTASAARMGVQALASGGQDSIVYVSLTAGSVPAGATATVRRIGDQPTAITAVIDGGFDPIAVTAHVGDFIEVVVQDAGGAVVRQLRLGVAALRPPVVVRTEPPPRKLDQPLNAALVVVFSEPVDGASVTTSSIRLLQGTSTVSGTVRFLDPSLDATHTSVEFVPDAPLAGQSDYRLIVTQQVRDLSNDRLAQPDTVPFETGQGSLGSPASIHTSPDSILSLHAGETYQLTAVVRDAAGNVLTDQPVTWSADTPSVVTVSPTGLVTAVADGNGLVIASVGSVSHRVWVFVEANPTATITIAPNAATVMQYDSVTLAASARDSAGRVINYLGDVQWTSSAPAIATVRSDGLVKGQSPGSVTITAKQGTAFGTAAVTVTAAPVTVSVTPDSATLVVSGYAMVFDTLRQGNTVIAGFSATWRSDNPAVATVDTNGLVKGISKGFARIIGTRDASSDTASITVGTISLASVSPTCALTTAGAAYCWGGNNGGELGMGTNQGPQTGTQCSLEVSGYMCSTVPVVVAGGLKFASLSAGGSPCGVTITGAAYCWGFEGLGDGSTSCGDCLGAESDVPVAVSGGLTWLSVSVSSDHTCGTTAAGATYCWGRNFHGQLGDGLAENVSNVPVPVSGGLTFASVSAASSAFYGPYTCGVTTSGAAYCWGSNDAGQLGDGSTTESHIPVAVTGGLTFASLNAGGNGHVCGLTTTGAAYCWGANYSGQLGDGSTTDSRVPVAVAGGLTFTSVGAGIGLTCGVTTTGTAYCWGDNRVGQVGDGSTTERHSPVLVTGGLSFATLSVRSWEACGLTVSGLAYCWGSNTAGALGNGTITNSSVPVRVAGQP